ncbi:TetR/AcrR family transcriptional regulator [Halovenus marina]|uniref:TetR/AcrR family transcriptional regulator n=1 Tax=Halovenus marina TaxID=3396621 RepID=UPI003F570556
MTDPDVDPEDRDTEELIMQATYRALCTHGYAETSISRIASEFEKSKALLYHHYDDKEDLFNSFLEWLLSHLETELETNLPEDPRERLEAIIDRMLPEADNGDAIRFRRAILEMRAQAPYYEAYHDQFRRSDELILGELRETIEAGVEAGKFRERDPDGTAELLYSLVYGTLERAVSLEDEAMLADSRRQIERYLETNVYESMSTSGSACG